MMTKVMMLSAVLLGSVANAAAAEEPDKQLALAYCSFLDPATDYWRVLGVDIWTLMDVTGRSCFFAETWYDKPFESSSQAERWYCPLWDSFGVNVYTDSRVNWNAWDAVPAGFNFGVANSACAKLMAE